MGSDGETLSVDTAVLAVTCQALSAAADQLRSQLTALDGDVGSMLSHWQGASGGSYSRAWVRWQRGADEVERGLAATARLLGEAGSGFAAQDQAGQAALSGLRDG